MIPHNGYALKNAGVAQLIERRLAKAKVAGLSPVSRSNFSSEELGLFYFPYNSKYLSTLRVIEGRTVFISRNFVIFHPSLTDCLPAEVLSGLVKCVLALSSKLLRNSTKHLVFFYKRLLALLFYLITQIKKFPRALKISSLASECLKEINLWKQT